MAGIKTIIKMPPVGNRRFRPRTAKNNPCEKIRTKTDIST